MKTSIQFLILIVLVNRISCSNMAIYTKDHGQGHIERAYVMYHGTDAKNVDSILNNGFQPSSGGMLGPGVYASTDSAKASKYPLNSGNKVLFKLLVRTGKVRMITNMKDPITHMWHNAYDTAWVPENVDLKAIPSGMTENCVKSSKQIKILGIAKGWNRLPPGTQNRLQQVAVGANLNGHENLILEQLKKEMEVKMSLEDFSLFVVRPSSVPFLTMPGIKPVILPGGPPVQTGLIKLPPGFAQIPMTNRNKSPGTVQQTNNVVQTQAQPTKKKPRPFFNVGANLLGGYPGQ